VPLSLHIVHPHTKFLSYLIFSFFFLPRLLWLSFQLDRDHLLLYHYFFQSKFGSLNLFIHCGRREVCLPSFYCFRGWTSHSLPSMKSSGTKYSSGFLTTQAVLGGYLSGSISFLQENTAYMFTIFAGDETYGYSFVVTTAPAREGPFRKKLFVRYTAFMFFLTFVAATSLTGQRNDNTSVLLSWDISPGTTRYGLAVSFVNGTQVSYVTFNVTNSTIVPDLITGVTYQFTLYSGNAYGIDTSQGATVQASTNSELALLETFGFISTNLLCSKL